MNRGWKSSVAWLVFVLLTSVVSAQGFLDGEVRIGVILPSTVSLTEDSASHELSVAVVQAAAQGADMAAEEFSFNAEMLGIDFTLVTVEASGAEAVRAAAESLLAEHGVFGVVAGFDGGEAAALADWSAATGVPFINVGSSDDALRNELCRPTMFHVEPSAAMYLDAMAGWYVRSGLRNWYFVVGEDEQSQAQLERALKGLSERHFGARSVGNRTISSEADLDGLGNAVRRASADLVVLLLPAVDQLAALTALEASGVEAMVTGFPYPEAETRTFYAASRSAAPKLGSGHRISSWEATLDAYGARELNARYRAVYGEPMDASAWAVYQGVKMLYDSAFFGASYDPADVVAYLGSSQAVFDVWKGIGTTFRPWDGQLRQSLYLSKIDSANEDSFALAGLVGELPAIYMPGTDPVERLDQIGDLAVSSTCRR